MTHFPRLFDTIKVKFERFTILKNKIEWEQAIYELCKKLSEKQHSCVIWFKNERDLKNMYHRLLDKQPYILTNSEISVNQFGEKKFLYTIFLKKMNQKYTIGREV